MLHRHSIVFAPGWIDDIGRKKVVQQLLLILMVVTRCVKWAVLTKKVHAIVCSAHRYTICNLHLHKYIGVDCKIENLS